MILLALAAVASAAPIPRSSAPCVRRCGDGTGSAGGGRRNPHARDATGGRCSWRRPEAGQTTPRRLLISAGADLNASARGFGTALEMAERTGHTDLAAICSRPARAPPGNRWRQGLRAALEGRRLLRHSRGRGQEHHPHPGDQVVGCRKGCPARAECSPGSPWEAPTAGHAGTWSQP